MTNAERKLDEAKFFLNQLNINDPYFDYILSAYLNASRSVIWVMRNEFSNISGWEEWFVSKIPDKEEDIIFKEINNLRIKSTKQAGVKTDFFIFDSIRVYEESYANVKKVLNWPNGTKFKSTISEHSKSKNKGVSPDSLNIIGRVESNKAKRSLQNRKKLLNLCKEYFGFLEQIISECNDKFTK